MLLQMLLKMVVKKGSLTLVGANGKATDFGNGEGPKVTARLHDRKVAREIALNPYLKLGEAYMDGRLTVDRPNTIYELIDILTSSLGNDYAGPLFRLQARWRRMKSST